MLMMRVPNISDVIIRPMRRRAKRPAEAGSKQWFTLMNGSPTRSDGAMAGGLFDILYESFMLRAEGKRHIKIYLKQRLHEECERKSQNS